MSKPAAFRAEYSDWKLIRTRKVVQIVFEVPVEQADEAYAVLGGMPDPSKSVWCAVARLKGGDAADRSNTEKTVETSPAPAQAPQSGRAKSPAQVAGYLCTLPPFWKFLREECQHGLVTNEMMAAMSVRAICDVKHRSEIIPGTEAAKRWDELRSRFRAWEMAVV